MLSEPTPQAHSVLVFGDVEGGNWTWMRSSFLQVAVAAPLFPPHAGVRGVGAIFCSREVFLGNAPLLGGGTKDMVS
eukprot:jgi/Botrbrau1/8273/Bobra.0251s0002.1